MKEQRDEKYLGILVEPIRVCASYKPKMGQGGRDGLSLKDFQRIYSQDPFYSWFGLDSPLMYAAHKAAGGMTSIYRQIGIGSEALIRAIFRDELGLSIEDTKWSYKVMGANKKERRLSLDARIPLESVMKNRARTKVRKWMNRACEDLGVDNRIARRRSQLVLV